jgi:CHAD domain-containing protein
MAAKIQPSLHPHEPTAAGLARMAAELVDAAVNRIDHPTSDRAEDIHQIRVSIKRLRALLLLLRPVISEVAYERENGRLRDAAQQLAGSRDAAVARKTLLALADSASGRNERKAFAKVLNAFRATVEPPAASARRAAMCKVAAALRESGERIPRLRLSSKGWKMIGSGLEAVYRAGRRRMRRAYASGDDLAFHRWRIRGKNLFYQLEMLAPIWPARICESVGRLKKLQHRIGDDHDLAVVKAVLEDAPDTFGGACATRRVLDCAKRRSRKLRKASRKLGKKIYDERPARFAGKLEKHWSQWRQPVDAEALPSLPIAPLQAHSNGRTQHRRTVTATRHPVHSGSRSRS